MKSSKELIAAPGFTLIEILVVIGMIAILATIVLIAINPARQFKQGRDTQRTSNVNAILNAIGQYVADHKGVLPAGIPVAPVAAVDVGTVANICNGIMPTYIPAVPTDPGLNATALTACTGTTDYTVQQDANGRVTVAAPSTELGPPVVSVTR